MLMTEYEAEARDFVGPLPQKYSALTALVENAKSYNIYAGGFCKDQEHCWQGKMAHYHDM